MSRGLVPRCCAFISYIPGIRRSTRYEVPGMQVCTSHATKLSSSQQRSAKRSAAPCSCRVVRAVCRGAVFSPSYTPLIGIVRRTRRVRVRTNYHKKGAPSSTQLRRLSYTQQCSAMQRCAFSFVSVHIKSSVYVHTCTRRPGCVSGAWSSWRLQVALHVINFFSVLFGAFPEDGGNRGKSTYS